ncbi:MULTISPECIES: hypothetical protein [unclassified Mesorhizobium]|nr:MULTISPECIES: hypothetical protein [unclassified Mesorhizobium]
MQIVWTEPPQLDIAAERERCATLAEAQARRFEKRKMYPIARAMAQLAEQIRTASPSA